MNRGPEVDPNIVRIATATVSAALAGLGLLVIWYRREERKDEHKSNRPFFAADSIVMLAVAGLALTFALSACAKNNTTSARPSTGAQSSSLPTRLSEAQYREKVTAACADAKAKARRIEQSSPQETVLGAAIKIEHEEVAQIKSLHPPDKLTSEHERMVSVWQRRIGLLESTYHRLPRLDDNDLQTELAAADRLAEQMMQSFKSLGVPECIM